MHLIRDFLRQEVPKFHGETQIYYQQAMNINDVLVAAYFLLMTVLIPVIVGQFRWMPLLALSAVLLKHYNKKKLSVRANLLIHGLIICVWVVWYVVLFGWPDGGQHLLIIVVFLAFFSIYEPPLAKLGYFFTALLVRMLLYDYAFSHAPLIQMTEMQGFFFQLANSLTVFLLIAGCCIVFSGNLQETERLLLLRNEQLQHQAETDPLTKLYNRRSLMRKMREFTADSPSAMFCVAIADIDFFKRVNDTYGHNCGDYVLKRLSDLFLEKSNGRYSVGRWGGEEFCFFFPNMNLDDAGSLITDVCLAVHKLEMEFEGASFQITLTAGVEENDYQSPLEALIDKADQKLYMGKNNGRDQVVI